MSRQQTPWTEDDREWARILGEHLGLEPGEQVEHFLIGVTIGSGQVDGRPRKVLVAACCKDTGRPTHLMNHVTGLLAGRN